MAKPKIEKDEESLHKLVRDYWESLKAEEIESMEPPVTRDNKVSRT